MSEEDSRDAAEKTFDLRRRHWMGWMRKGARMPFSLLVCLLERDDATQYRNSI